MDLKSSKEIFQVGRIAYLQVQPSCEQTSHRQKPYLLFDSLYFDHEGSNIVNIDRLERLFGRIRSERTIWALINFYWVFIYPVTNNTRLQNLLYCREKTSYMEVFPKFPDCLIDACMGKFNMHIKNQHVWEGTGFAQQYGITFTLRKFTFYPYNSFYILIQIVLMH